MVRERVGDWRSAWRFALAGLLAGLLVVATSQTSVAAPLFNALQDQLFPVPAPNAQVTLVALDSAAAKPFGPFPWGNGIHAQVIDYLASLHPKMILFNLLIGWPTFEACSDYIEVDEMPGLQLKGKSAEKFRVLRVTAIREGRDAQWVEIPTDAALESYETYKQRYAQQSVFAAAPQTEA